MVALSFVVALAVTQAPATSSDKPALSPCAQKLIALGDAPSDIPPTEPLQCRSVVLRASMALRDKLEASAAANALTPADVQPSAAGAAAPPGTSAQDAGARTVKTVGLLGASATVTTAVDSTLPVMVAIRVNPLGLVAQDDAKSFAQRARLTDFTVLVPASFVDTGTLPNQVGARMTFDATGLAASKHFTDLANTFVAAHQRALAEGGELAHALELALLATKDKSACIDALFAEKATATSISEACGVDVAKVTQEAVDADAEFSRAKQSFRDETDKFHLGATLDVDIPLNRSATMPFRVAAVAASSLHLQRFHGGALEGRLDAGADYNSLSGFGGTAALSLAFTGSVVTTPVSAVLGARSHFGAPLANALAGTPNQAGSYLFAEGTLRTSLGDSGVELALTVSWPVISWDGQTHRPSASVSLDYQKLLAAFAGLKK